MKIRSFLLLYCLLLLSCKENLVEEESFGRLSFSASGCFGSCPIMQVEIDSEGNYYFRGIMYTDKTGFYKGQMTDSLYEEFMAKLEMIQNYKLQPNETPLLPIPDAPVYSFKIMSKNGDEIKYDILQEDEQLILFLLKSYKQIKLSEVDTLTFLLNE